MWKLAVCLACAAGLLLGQETQAPSESPVAKQPSVKSQGEGEAVMAMFRAPDDDARIKAAEELLTKFADTEFKAIALQFIADAYQRKNDYPNMVVYAERTLEADPDNYLAMLMLAAGIAQRTREFDLDREEKLATAEKYAKTALEILKTAPRPNPAITDEQWTAVKKDFSAQGYEALGLVAMARQQFDVAIEQFKKSMETASTEEPTTKVRLGIAYNKAGKYDEAIAILDQVMSAPDVHPQIKQFAQAERARAIQNKGGGAQPADAPPQVEIKQP